MSALALFGTGNSTSVSAAAAVNLTAGKPANTADGDLLVAHFYSQAQAGTINVVPTGWTLAASLTTRRGGWYYKAIPTASAETATTYQWGCSGSGRVTLHIFRVTGADLTNPLDAVGAQIETTGASAALPAVTAVTATALLLALAYYNNSGTTTSALSTASGMTLGDSISSPTTGNTSGTAVAQLQLAASGSTGTKTFTDSPASTNTGGVMIAIKAAAVVNPSVTATLGAAADLSATTTQGVAGVASMPAAASLTAIGTAGSSGSASVSLGASAALTASTGAVSGLASLSATASIAASATTPLTQWIAARPMNVGHRAVELDWPEETMYGYAQMCAWNTGMALEISVQQSSDGVWVASHDQTTGRVFAGTSLDIPSNTWATLSSKVTINGSYPIAKLVDILDAFPGRIFWVDNKNTVNISNFLDTLDAHGGPSRILVKGYSGSTGYASLARARGYLTWGFFYAADIASLPTRAPYWDLLGGDVTGSTSDWTALKSYGKPIVAHTINNVGDRNAALALGADGYMAAKATDGTVPQTPSVATTSATVTLTATGAGAGAGGGSATITAVPTLTTTSKPGVLGTAALIANPAMTASSTQAVASAAALGATAALSATGTAGSTGSAAPTLGAAVSLVVNVRAGVTASANLAATAALTTASSIGIATAVTLGVIARLVVRIGTVSRNIKVTATTGRTRWSATTRARRWKGTTSE